MTPQPPIASVIVPAHDEEGRIEATLRTLLADARPGEFDVTVVCNGCTDATAERARRVPGVQVVELAEASKVAALREGDRRAAAFPRIYLDADTLLPTAGARALVAALDAPHVRVAGMPAELDLRGASRPARWFHEFRQQLPVFAQGIIGAGVYALDRDARRRLGDWPDVLGDDQFVLRSFAPSERATVPEHRTRVAVEGDLRAVVRRGVRVRRGNAELTTGAAGVPLPPPPSGAGSALLRAAGQPRRWPGAIAWLLVGAVVRARVRLGRDRGDWAAVSLADRPGVPS